MDPRSSLDKIAVVTSSFFVDDILRQQSTNDIYENRITKANERQHYFHSQELNLCATAPLYSFGDKGTIKDYARSHEHNLNRTRIENPIEKRNELLHYQKIKESPTTENRPFEELSCMVAEAERKAERTASLSHSNSRLDQPNNASKIPFLSFWRTIAAI